MIKINRLKKYNKYTSAFLVAFLVACGGGNDSISEAPKPEPKSQTKIFIHPSDRLIANTGYDIQIQPTQPNNPLPTVQNDVFRQSQLGNNVMLWIGGKTDEVFKRLPNLINEAKNYTNIKTVYLYDEMFWNGSAIEIGLHEKEVLEGARLSHEAGLKTAIVMLPEVILSKDFKLKDINAFDLIGIDVYPSIRVDNNTYGCSYGNNNLENLLRCSIDKLKKMGFKGKTGYVYQAFFLNSLPLETNIANAAMQRSVIDASASYGVDILIPWGLYLGKQEIASEPYLLPLGATQYEKLVDLPK